MASTNRVLIYGGRGALGSVCVRHFKQNNWWVGSIDLAESPDANASIVLNVSDDIVKQEKHLLEQAKQLLQDNKVQAVLCVAGGWAGGNAASDDFIKNTDLMIKQSVWSSVLAARLASHYLAEGGLLTLTGAKAANGPTEGMIGYGLAKAAVHQLTKSLSASTSGLPTDSRVITILPVTLDTPMNRKWMPKADFTSWTPLETVADLFYKWTDKSNQNQPTSGSLISLITKDSKTTLEIN